MRNLEHAKQVQSCYRTSRKALNNWGKEKDRSKAGLGKHYEIDEGG